MHPALILAALASAGGVFTVLPGQPRGGPLLGTLLPILVTVAFAVAVSGRPNAVALMAGAVAALVGSVAWAVIPELGGALVVGLAYAERSLRVRPLRLRLVHVGLAVAVGAGAGALAEAYASAPLLYRSVAVVMCAVVSLVPFFMEADAPGVRVLEDAAKQLGPPIAAALLDGAELLRCDTSLLDRETASNVRKSWRSLEKLVEARLAMAGGGGPTRRGETAAMVTAMVDRQITEHIASLTRAYAAVTTMGAAEVGIDDTALRDVHARGEALDEQSRAIVEVGRR